MSITDANLLTSDKNWVDTFEREGSNNLYYTFYNESDLDPIPSYYYIDGNFENGFVTEYTDIAIEGTETEISQAQEIIISYFLDDNFGDFYRVSFSDVSNVNFFEKSGVEEEGQIFILNADLEADEDVALAQRPEGSTFQGDIIFDNDADGIQLNSATLNPGQPGAFIVLQELAHAIVGLEDSGTAGIEGIKDTQQYTIMTNTWDGDGDIHQGIQNLWPAGLQILDIWATQKTYGVNFNTRNENLDDDGNTFGTTYGLDMGLGGGEDGSYDGVPFIYTIWDGGGNDIIKASGYAEFSARIDLRQGEFSSLGSRDGLNAAFELDASLSPIYVANNVAIAYYTIIENAFGSDNADVLIGNAWDNIIYGGGGNDSVLGDGFPVDGNAGFHEQNTFEDEESNVFAWGTDDIAPDENDSGNDILIGGQDNDTLYGGYGNDILHGGFVRADIDGIDSTWNAAGHFDIEDGVVDIAYADDGMDTVNYSALDTGLLVNVYANQSATTVIKINFEGQSAGTDTLFSIEKIIGNVDAINIVTLNGFSTIKEISPNIYELDGQRYEFENFYGFNGDTGEQVFALNAPSGRTIDGGDANDTVKYANSDYAVQIDLSGTYAPEGGSAVAVDENGTPLVLIDELASIESAAGSAYDDTFIGSDADNTFSGGAGNDSFDGRGGTNTLSYRDDGGAVQLDVLAGTATDGAGDADNFVNIQNFDLSRFSDTVVITDYRDGQLINGYRGYDDTVDLSSISDDITSLNDLGYGFRSIEHFILGDGNDALRFDFITSEPGSNVTYDFGDGTDSARVSVEAYALDGKITTTQGQTFLNVEQIIGASDTYVMELGHEYTPNGGSSRTVNYADYANKLNFTFVSGGDLIVTEQGGTVSDIISSGSAGTRTNATIIGSNNGDTFQNLTGNFWFGTGDDVATLSGNTNIYYTGGTDTIDLSLNGLQLNFGPGMDAGDVSVTNVVEGAVYETGAGYTRLSVDVTLSVANHSTITLENVSRTILSTGEIIDSYIINEPDGNTNQATPYDDLLFNQSKGGSGDDIMYANDALVFSPGYLGGSGNDTIYSNGSPVFGGSGGDVIYGGQNGSSDGYTPNLIHLYGNDGGDTIKGSDFAAEEIYGGSGQDVLKGSGGFDMYFGGSERDDFVIFKNGDHEIVQDFTTGEDKINLSAFNEIRSFADLEFREVDFSSGFISDPKGTDGSFGISALAEEYQGSFTEVILGDYGTILLLAGVTPDELSPDDFIFTPFLSTDADDVIDISTGTTYASLSLAGGNDSFIGSNLSDTVFGDDGNDNLSGGAGSDELHGGAGNDTLVGGAGNDSLFGGDGDDVYEFAAGDGFDRIIDTGGIDTLHISGDITLDDLTFSQIGNDLHIDIASGVTIIGQYSADPAVVVEWLSFDDGTVVELPNPYMNSNQPPIAVIDYFVGEGGLTISGNVITNDSDPNGDMLSVEPFLIITSNGAAVEMLADGSFTYTPADGFEGFDEFSYTLSDGLLTDTADVYINIEPPSIRGTSGDDILVGTSEDDVMRGFEGQDILISNGGYDTMYGGEGYDSYYLTVDGEAYIEDGTSLNRIYLDGVDFSPDTNEPFAFEFGGQIEIYATDFSDFPIAVISGSPDFGAVVFNNTTTLMIQDLLDGNYFNAITVSDSSDFVSVNQGTPIDLLGGNDDFYGSEDADYVDGGDGSDYLSANGGDDLIKGGDGNDYLYGGSGDDFLQGGLDNDNLYGGSGNDTYAYAIGDGSDTIEETSGEDTLLIQGEASLEDVSFAQSATSLYLFFDGSADIITIRGQYSGDASKVVEWIEFADGSRYELPNPIMQTNQPPIAVGEQFTGDEDFIITGNVLGNDSDPDGDVLSIEPFTIITSNGATVEMLANGSFTYTPALNYNGTDSFDYTLSDGELTDVATVELTVNAVNDDPTAQADAYAVNEDGVLSGNVLTNDSDVDGDDLSVVADDIITANGGSVLLLSNGDFIYSPAVNYNGSDSFEYSVTDGQGGVSTALVNINVVAVNDAPIANDDFFGFQEDVIATGNVLANDTDIDGDALSIQPQSITTLSGGQIELQSNGDFTYTPAENYNGTDSFEYTLTDAQGASVTGMAFLDIEAVNDEPEAKDDSFAGTENSEVEGNLLADNGNGVDFDLDGDVLRVGQDIIASAQGGSVIIMANGDFTYMPPTNYSGYDSFEYAIYDDQGGSDTATVDIYLEPLNDPPEARDDSFDGIFDITITGNVLDDNGNGADSDPNGDELTVQPNVFVTVNGGLVTINDDGSFAYTPADGYYGQDSFDYTVYDEQGASALATATVTIEQPDQVGDDGFDLLFGSRGDDVLAGLDGTDILFGRDGNDLLSGGDGLDLLHGNNGNDTLIGGADKDYLFGGKGNDTMYGGTGDDRLLADKGDDFLYGGDGRDYLDGGKGNDVLRGGDGADYLKGGKGADTFKFGADEEGVDRIKDFSEREGDAIDISDVLIDDYDPVADLLSNYVTVERQGKDSVLKVDADGAGTDHEMEVVAIINNNRNLDAQEMYDQGSLII
ncbi:MAG TPA: tandem-95 repeat protein [Micavibrio sp.]|nr:tandem-95 repeat protein [Micavibrio sp.]HIL29318.1 tandem-95 repeat protein [Micavibrio sp.]